MKHHFISKDYNAVNKIFVAAWHNLGRKTKRGIQQYQKEFGLNDNYIWMKLILARTIVKQAYSVIVQ